MPRKAGPTTQPSEKLAVAIHAGDPVTRAGLTRLLGGSSDLRVLPGWDAAAADVLVITAETARDDATELVKQAQTMSARSDSVPCVLITETYGETEILRALQFGVVAILRYDEVMPLLESCVFSAHEGEARLPASLQGAVLAQLRRLREEVLEPNGLTLSGLSVRECDVLRLVADGLSTKEIAQRLAYAERTVKNILYGLMTRLHLNNRAHAVSYALRIGAI